MSKASKELERLGVAAEGELRKVLASHPPLELRRRVTSLLERLDQNESVRPARLTFVLEQTATPEARRVLDMLAKQAPNSKVAQESRASLERLALRDAANSK